MTFSPTTEIFASNKREAIEIAKGMNRDEGRHIKIAINSIKLKRKTTYGQNVYSAKQRSKYYRFDNQESQMQILTKKEGKERLLRQRDWNMCG